MRQEIIKTLSEPILVRGGYEQLMSCVSGEVSEFEEWLKGVKYSLLKYKCNRILLEVKHCENLMKSLVPFQDWIFTNIQSKEASYFPQKESVDVYTSLICIKDIITNKELMSDNFRILSTDGSRVLKMGEHVEYPIADKRLCSYATEGFRVKVAKTDIFNNINKLELWKEIVQTQWE